MDIVSSGDNGNLQHSNSISNKEHIGDYTSPGGEKMSFFYFSNEEPPILVQLNVGNTETLIPLWIPELNINRNRDFVLPTVRRYLKDSNRRPEYCRLDEQVRFFSVHPKDKHRDWILKDHSLSLPNQHTLFVYQSNGCVSYVNENEVITWDYKDGSSRESLIPTSPSTITALTEQNGSLIVGCEGGHFYLPNFGWICRNKSPVVEIVAIGSTSLAVRYRDELVMLFISENGVGTHFSDRFSKIWSVRDRLLVMLRGKRVLLFFDINTNKFVSGRIFPEYNNIYVVSDTIYVATKENISIWEEGTSWNTLTEEDFLNFWQTHEGVICDHKDCSQCLYHKRTIEAKIAETAWEDLIKSIQNKTFVFLPSGVFIFPQSPMWDVVCVTYFSIFANPPKRPKTFHVDGTWGVTSMSLLSDGSSIMYASDTRGSGIHVITTNGERIFSKKEELTKNKKIVSFKEMEGSVATQSFDNNEDSLHIRVITPRDFSSENFINRVTELRSKFTSNPSNLDLYEELARKFLPTDYSNVLDHHSAYHTYLDGLVAAAQAKDLYRARRFYEKAKNIFPDRDEPMRLFLYYRKQFPNCKIERNIQFDPAGLLKNKNCKRRLFIGEGDFSFTEALIKKHMHTHNKLPSAIVATELRENNPNETNYSVEIDQRINSLKKKGVRILTKIDGRKIHEHPELRVGKFKRIHWNCPFISAPADRQEFTKVMPEFFRSCGEIQSTGDRIHVTLMQGYNDGYWHERRQYENPIVKGSMESCYHLIRKRNFGKARYPEYNHTKATGEVIHAPGVHREFVFEKVSSPMFSEEVTIDKIKKKNSLPINNSHKKYFIKVNKKGDVSVETKPEDCYFDCSTDEDSSDYYSDSD